MGEGKRLPLALLALLTLVGVGAGCASSPRTDFFMLSSGLPDGMSGQHDGARNGAHNGDRSTPGGRSVIVEPAALPELVDRPQLVIQTDAQQVVILDQQRWAEPLRAGISRVVADSLGKQLGHREVSSREEVIRKPDCRVRLDVRRLEARAGQAVTIETLWVVACQDRPRRSGWSAAREPVAGAGQAAMIAAHGRALDRLSRDIAPALR